MRFPNFSIQPAKNSLHPLIARVAIAAKPTVETFRGTLRTISLTSPTILDAQLLVRFLRNLKLCDCAYTTTLYRGSRKAPKTAHNTPRQHIATMKTQIIKTTEADTTKRAIALEK